MSIFSIKGVVKVLPSVFTGKNKEQITDLNEALRQEADCGCGIDCCNNVLVLRDQSNDTPYELAFVSGVLSFRVRGSGGGWSQLVVG